MDRRFGCKFKSCSVCLFPTDSSIGRANLLSIFPSSVCGRCVRDWGSIPLQNEDERIDIAKCLKFAQLRRLANVNFQKQAYTAYLLKNKRAILTSSSRNSVLYAITA